MLQNYFLQRKQALLTKKDKSSIGEWDKKIKKLCNTLNKFPQYYTTSSCSGRILIMIEQDKKGKNLFEFVSHDLIQFEEFIKKIKSIKTKKDLKFKSEPMILHVACEKLEDANHLLKIAQKSRFKKIGIITLKKRIIVEINGSEKIEFPLIQKGKILVDEKFLEIVLEKSNKNLKKNWEKINRFEKLI